MTGEDARRLELELDFLDPGMVYRAQIYRDGDDAHWKTNPYSIVIEELARACASTALGVAAASANPSR